MTETAPAETKRKLRPLLRLFPWLRPYAGTVILASLALLVAAAATLVLPVAFRYMIDLGFSPENAHQINRYFIALFGVATVLALATAARYYLVTWTGERVVADLRASIYRHVLTMSPIFFETTRTGEVLSRLTTDTTLIQTVFGSSFSIALRNVLMLIGGLVMLMFTSPILTGMIGLVIPLVLVPIIFFGRRVRTLSRASQDRVADTSSIAQEVLNAMTTVQAYNQQAAEDSRFSERVEIAFATALRRIRTRAFLTATVILLVFGAIVLVLASGAHAVIDGRMTPGELGQFLLYAILTAGAVGALSETWGEIQQAAGATERLMELLDTEPMVRSPEYPKQLPSPCQGAVSFEQVTFRYPSRPDHPVLQDFSLRIEPGETVALVGPSGAGKTTVFQLLLRYYNLEAGHIDIDGVNTAECDPADVRAKLAIVPQDTVIFAANALENIRYGRTNASDAEVINAAEHAAADTFIRAQPEGYETFLGERGLRLSGGQKQRIAIARAMLKNAPIILLDEATSALDAESERLVHDALSELTAQRTTLVIAHRLSTVMEADRIVVMDQGKVVASGRHAELIKEDGLYARLAKLQFRSE